MVELPNHFSCQNALIFYTLKHVFLLILLWCDEYSSVRVSKVKIIRSIEGQVDRIRFPRQLCGTAASAENIGCDTMQKRKGQSCSCTCNITNPSGTSYVKNTVVYNNGSWLCLGNAKVRQFAGCNVLSVGETITDPIPDISRKRPYVFKTPDQRCRVNFLNSAYSSCTGTWKRLSERVLRRFVNTSRRFTKDEILLEYSGVTESHHNVNGRVIRLAVSCRKQKKNKNVGCIVMKMKGKMRCPFMASSRPTDDTKVSIVTTATRNVTTKTEPPLPRHLHRPKIGASRKNIEKRESGVDDQITVFHPLAVILGAFAVVIVTIVVVSAFVVMVMRKKLNSFDDQRDEDDGDLKFLF
ncbi:uncharacterized protein LOC116295611 [Actinia tenebrosa]|uniref:Uncharacterized protein LOC116295611 n=1 Tax=Actinia tenebrosa TaxID=6105 RepID=A0A6P8HSJ9_ACTTE|nr:uncharacterized protein LOC116295611 [Actinia tenebrosa]